MKKSALMQTPSLPDEKRLYVWTVNLHTGEELYWMGVTPRQAVTMANARDIDPRAPLDYAVLPNDQYKYAAHTIICGNWSART